MGLRINTNVTALQAQRNLRQTNQALSKGMERLGSGLRINHAADDAAGLALSEIMRASARGLTQNERNAQDAISVVQIAEGGLNEVSNLLIRMRELGVQSASDTIGQQERGYLDIECRQLLAEIQRIAQTTEFNHVCLLDGTSGNLKVQIGLRNHPLLDRINLVDEDGCDVNPLALGIHLTSVADKLSAQMSLAAIDGALTSVTAIRAKFGAMQNRLGSVINNLAVSRENTLAAMSHIRDMDMAEETAELTKNQILMQSGISVLAQANSGGKLALSLLDGGGSG